MSFRVYQILLALLLFVSLLSSIAGLFWFFYLIAENVIVLSSLIISLILAFLILVLVLKSYVLSDEHLEMTDGRLLGFASLRLVGLFINGLILYDVFQKILPFDNQATLAWLLLDLFYLTYVAMALRPSAQSGLKLAVLLGIMLLVMTALFVYKPEYSPMQYHGPDKAKPERIEPTEYKVSY